MPNFVFIKVKAEIKFCRIIKTEEILHGGGFFDCKLTLSELDTNEQYCRYENELVKVPNDFYFFGLGKDCLMEKCIIFPELIEWVTKDDFFTQVLQKYNS